MYPIRSFLLLSLVIASPGFAEARDLTWQEKDALVREVDTFENAIVEGNLEAVSATIPPRVLAHIAEKGGVDIETLRTVIVGQMEAVFAKTPLSGFTLDTDETLYRALSSGTPYALVPTETVVVIDNQPVTMRSHTLALLDEGEWYLLRVSEAQQVAILRQVYPEFAETEFPASTQ